MRICITVDGTECGLYFSHSNPSASFNTSGYGEFKLAAAPAGRIAGRWVLAEPDDFFGETYDFDLNFDVAITPPPGTPLPADGGEPGKAYRAWTAAVAKGDIKVLSALVGSEYDAWRIKSDDQDDVKAALKDLRDGTPVQAKVLRGRIDGETAVLWIEGRDRDEILRRGRVLLAREDGTWRFKEADLDSGGRLTRQRKRPAMRGVFVGAERWLSASSNRRTRRSTWCSSSCRAGIPSRAISSIGCSSLRRIQIFCSRSGSISRSSRRVPERLMSIAG